MKTILAIMAVVLVLPAAALAQGSERGQQKREEAQRQRTAKQARNAEDQARHREAQERRRHLAAGVYIPARARLLRNGGRWAGPVYARDAFRLEHPWAAGRFAGGLGPRYVWHLKAGNRERFDTGAGWFALAPADYEHANDWRWDNDDMVLYPDTDHDGWYLAYNPRTGTYTHLRYLGN